MVLAKVMKATKWAFKDNSYLFRVEGGMVAAEHHPEIAEIIIFNYVEDDTWDKFHFWMNESSVKDMLDKVMTECEMVDFSKLFCGEEG